MITNCHTKYEGTARKTRLPGAPGLFEKFWIDRGILILAAVLTLPPSRAMESLEEHR